MLLNKSVGRKGVNTPKDVKLAQMALNRVIRIPFALLKVDGINGPITISAIERFQKEVLGFNKPDGLIEAGGKTWTGLEKYLVESPSHKTAMFNIFDGLKEITQSKEDVNIKVNSKPIKIAWGAKVSAAFKNKVIQICEFLEVSPDFLMSCMAFESGSTFSPSIKNAAGSGAVGLIQFMPLTAKALGTTTDKLSKMTAVEQLDYVKKYFTPYKSKLKKLEDVYLAILYPAAVGKPLTHVLFEDGKKTYTQNKGFDKDKNGKITLIEVSATVRKMYEKGLTKGYMG